MMLGGCCRMDALIPPPANELPTAGRGKRREREGAGFAVISRWARCEHEAKSYSGVFLANSRKTNLTNKVSISKVSQQGTRTAIICVSCHTFHSIIERGL
jgi:hypothetical protein